MNKNILRLFFLILNTNFIFSMDSDGCSNSEINQSANGSHCQITETLGSLNNADDIEKFCEHVLDKNIKLDEQQIEKVFSICDKNYHTPAHFAAKKLNLRVLEFLVKHKIFSLLCNLNVENVIHIALKYGNDTELKNIPKDITQKCINFIELSIKNYEQCERDTFLNSPDGWGYTPLYLAVLRWDITVINFLLNSGANINILSDKSQINILKAAINRDEEIFKLILSKLDYDNFNKLNSAVLEIIKNNNDDKKSEKFKNLWQKRSSELNTLRLFHPEHWEQCNIV